MRAPVAVPLAVAGAVAGAGAVTLAYASLVERRWYRLRRVRVPVLPAGAPALRILHVSDLHLTAGQARKIAWVRRLARLEPDLVVSTGDAIAAADALPAYLHAVEPLLARPGAFVLGSNDFWSPVLRNPLRYLVPRTKEIVPPRPPDLPWRELVDAMSAAGWVDLDNRRGLLHAAGRNLEVAGVGDSHVRKDRYDEIAGPVDPAADLHLGLLHSPEPRVLDRFVADGFRLLLAGHTHGGQVCVPFYGPLVTNCGIDRHRARGLSRHGAAWLHVSAGLGTSPYAPVRFACPPEATLLTLVPAAPSAN